MSETKEQQPGLQSDGSYYCGCGCDCEECTEIHEGELVLALAEKET